MKNILFVFCFYCFFSAYSQTDTKSEDYFQPWAKGDSIAYSRDYIFTEGFYLHSSDFRKNAPITKEQVLMDYPKSQTDFWQQMVSKKKIKYKTDLDEEKTIVVNEIWGLCDGRNIYIKSNAYGLTKLIIVGSLCFLVMDPNSNPIYSTSPIENAVLNTSSKTFKLRLPIEKYIFDIKNGKLFTANTGDLKLIFEKQDKDLFSEFSALKYKKRKNSIILYLKKYNEKHPLYLPAK